MERALYKELVIWKNQPNRLPLIVRGARQVGKSFLIEQFGKQEFQTLHTINFEKTPQFKECFNSLNPIDVVRELELQLGKKINIGGSLLFLDEIQDCPQALKALRYFAEEMPHLHVIAAGSILEFVLEDKQFSFPVGRIQMMNLGPLTFTEYLRAKDQSLLVDLLKDIQKSEEISEAVHQKLLKLVWEFMRVGGMPGVVATYNATNSFLEVQRRQAAILDLYALDFGKYATKYAQHYHLKKLFERVPDLAGKHFKFSKIDPDCANPARDYRESLNRLRQARLILQVHSTSGNGLPLRAEKSEKTFKIFMLDVGLLLHGLAGYSIEKGESLSNGVVAEQFVAQELCALQDPFIERGLYYWEKAERGSTAEIDFLVNLNQKMVPIEVKSGTIGKLFSLKQFLKTKNCSLGVRISENPFSLDGNIISIPFYLISEMDRLLIPNVTQKLGI